MSKIGEKGFTLVETLVALAIAGVLVAIAVPSYKFYVARTQVTESLSSASMQSFSVAQNLKRGRCTTVAGVNDVYPNRFGTLTISGAKVTSKGENCPSGCTATFLFNDTFASPNYAKSSSGSTCMSKREALIWRNMKLNSLLTIT